MGRSGEEQQVMGLPWHMPPIISVWDSCNRFSYMIAISFANSHIIAPVCGKLVRFIKDNEIIRMYARITEPIKDPRTGKGINAYNDAIAIISCEGVVGLRIITSDDVKGKAKKRKKFPTPVTHQTSRSHNEDSFQ